MDSDNPLIGRIVDSRTGQAVPLAGSLARVREADVVLLGERHDNPDHHALQAYVLGELIRLGRRPALVFEMIDQDQTDALTAWRQARSRRVADLDAAVTWEQRGWPDFSWYAPLFSLALEHDLPIYPGNPPRDRVRAIARGQDPEAGAALGLNRPLPPALAADLQTTLRESHCGMAPEEALPSIARAQRAKDATMAKTAETALREGADSVVIITGAEHARKDRGVPYYLPLGRTSLSLAFTEALGEESNPLAYKEAEPVTGLSAPHDLLWFTPRMSRENPCEALAKHFKTQTHSPE